MVHMDNMVETAYINCQGGVHLAQLLDAAREILCWACTQLRSIKAVYILGVLNRGADIMSRGGPQDKNRILHLDLILQVWSRFGKMQLDLLVTQRMLSANYFSL